METKSTYVIFRVTMREKRDLIAQILREGYKDMTEFMREKAGLK
jgi:hypothetical protein